MANELTLQQNAAQIAAFRELFGESTKNSDLSNGASLGFPVFSIRGKVWRIVAGGVEQALVSPDGDPIPAVPLVIIKSSPIVSKTYYGKTFSEGDDSAPDCASTDGIRPDPGVPAKQCDTCAMCPRNQWGSRVTNDGQSRGKACSDNRRLAVMLASNLDDDRGPIMLRVPPVSLGALVGLKGQLDKVGLPYQAVVVKASFDVNVAYPKLTFTPLRVLSLEEAKKVKALMASDALEAMFQMSITESAGAPAPAAAPAPAPAPEPAPAPAAKPVAAAVADAPPKAAPASADLDVGSLLKEVAAALGGNA